MPTRIPSHRRDIVGIIPFHGSDIRFHDRIIHWANFIYGNKLRDDFRTSLIIPKQYSEYLSASVLNSFETIKAVDGSEYMAMIGGRRSTVDYLRGAVADDLDIAFFLFAANEPVLRSAYPHAVAFHFEAGILSRGLLPQLIQYDPIGLYKYGALNELDSLKLSERSSILCIDITNCARKAMMRVTNKAANIMKADLTSFIDKFDKIALLALPKDGDPSIVQFVGRTISCQDLITMFIHALPCSIGIIATMHPAENVQIVDDEFIIANQNRVKVVPTGGSILSSDFFSLADTIIVVNSMTGAQAKLAGLKMICSENHPLRVLSDSVFTVSQYRIDLNDNLNAANIDIVLGYILTYLHLPSTIWNLGYGASYVKHFLSGGSINTLSEDPACNKKSEDVRTYYKSYFV